MRKTLGEQRTRIISRRKSRMGANAVVPALHPRQILPRAILTQIGHAHDRRHDHDIGQRNILAEEPRSAALGDFGVHALIGAKRGRKARLKVGTRTAGAGISSMKCINERILARCTGSCGVKSSGSGATSSRYSIMTDESMTIAPSWSSVGTTPFGLSAKYSGLSWSPARRSSLISAKGSCFAFSTNRTRWLHVDCGAL